MPKTSKKPKREATAKQKEIAARKTITDAQWRAYFEAETAEGWRPETGSVLYGVVEGIAVGGMGSVFGAYPLLTIRTEDGEFVKLHAFHTVLRNQLKSKSIGEGDSIGVRYEGSVDAGGDFGPYENYTVVVRHKAGSATRLVPDLDEAHTDTDAPEEGEDES